MILEPPNGLRLGIARRRHIQLHAALLDHRDDVPIFLGSNAVPQAHGSHGDRLTDAFGPGGISRSAVTITPPSIPNDLRPAFQPLNTARITSVSERPCCTCSHGPYLISAYRTLSFFKSWQSS